MKLLQEFYSLGLKENLIATLDILGDSYRILVCFLSLVVNAIFADLKSKLNLFKTLLVKLGLELGRTISFFALCEL